MRRLALGLLLGLLGATAAGAQTIGVNLQSMAFDKRSTDCKFTLAVDNVGGPEVHEYRIFFFVVTEGRNAKLCEQRLGHPNPKYHEHCSNETKIRCEDVQLLTLLEMQCLDAKNTQVECRTMMEADNVMLQVELAEPPFALEDK